MKKGKVSAERIPLTLVKSEHMDDWYIIERAEHDGREWFESTGPNSMSLMCSSRISDADVEGQLSEMVELAAAIRARTHAGFKRCAVDARGEHAEFWSPRNSRVHGRVTLADADQLAEQIEALVIESKKASPP